MASFSTTELNVTIPEAWDTKMEEYRYAEATLINLIYNKTANVKKADRVHMPIDAVATSAETTGSNGQFSETVRTPTTVDVIINSDIYHAEAYETAAEALSYWTPASNFNDICNKLFNIKYDQDIAALFASLTGGTLGTNDAPIAFDADVALAALLKLRNKNIPIKDLSFALPPVAIYNGIAKDDRFTDICKSGVASQTPLITGKLDFSIAGVPTYESTLLTQSPGSSGIQAALFHKSVAAIAFAIKGEHEAYKKHSAGYFQHGLASRSFYGKVAFRTDHGVLMYVRDT